MFNPDEPRSMLEMHFKCILMCIYWLQIEWMFIPKVNDKVLTIKSMFHGHRIVSLIEMHFLIRFLSSVSSEPCRTTWTDIRFGRIVGGSDAAHGSTPYIASLTRRGGHFCGWSNGIQLQFPIHNHWFCCRRYHRQRAMASDGGALRMHVSITLELGHSAISNKTDCVFQRIRWNNAGTSDTGGVGTARNIGPQKHCDGKCESWTTVRNRAAIDCRSSELRL